MMTNVYSMNNTFHIVNLFIMNAKDIHSHKEQSKVPRET